MIKWHLRFTGQKEDASGLQYFNARFYDPVIGMFVSPDTIVADPGNVFAYNRLMYALGNPLRFIDPTGHYSQTELQEHFGCGDDWNCVVANFQDGGQYAGMWGWLQILIAAQDGDVVQSTLMLQQENGMMSNASMQGTFARENGKIVVQNGKTTGSDGTSSSWNGAIDEFGFAQFANAGGSSTSLLHFGTYQMQGQKSGFMQVMKDSKTCGVPENCSTMILDGISTGASGVAVGCAMAGQIECSGPASAISTAASVASTGITAIGVWYRHEDWPDLVVSVVTLGTGAKYGDKIQGFGASIFQSWYDFRE